MPVLYAKIVNGVISGNVQSEPFGSLTVSGSSNELTGNVVNTWDWGVSPVDSNGAAIYTNWPYDDTGVFIGDYLKGKPAEFTINWNIQPVGFNASNVITLFEKFGVIQDFIQVNPLKYTFSYLPNVTPAQIVIKANSVSNGSIKLNNDIYSQAILTEYRPYVITEITDYYGGTYSTYVTDTSVTPNLERYYIVAATTTQALSMASLKLTFNNFNLVPTTFTEAGYTSASATSKTYYFDSTDIVSNVTYSHYYTGTIYPSITSNTTYGFLFGSTPPLYAWPSTSTLAAQTTRIRSTPLNITSNTSKYAGVMKFNIAKGTYVDKTSTIANVDGIPLYLGIFGDTTTGAAELLLEITPVKLTRFSNPTSIKFRTNHYTALLQLNSANIQTKYGKLTSLVPDTTDPFGLTYTSTYSIAAPNIDYIDETITAYPGVLSLIASGSTSSGGNGFFTNKATSKTVTKTLSIKQTPTKYLNSTLKTNIKTSTLSFTVDTPIFADNTVPANSTTITPVVSLLVKDTSNNTALSILNTSILPISNATTGTTTITITLPTSGLTRNTQYTVNIPTTFGINDSGTYLEDLTKTNITQTFTVDSNPISVSSFSFNAPISITNINPYISTIAFNKAILTINTSQPFITIADKTNPTVPLISIPYSSNTLAVQYSGTLGGYSDTVLSSAIYSATTLLYTNYTFNKNRELRIDKTYQVTVHTDYCTDRYNNLANVYTSDFTLTKTDLNIQSIYLEGKLTEYDRIQVVLTAPYALYANTSNIVVSLTDGTNTYTSATSAVTTSIVVNTLTLTFDASVYKNSTNYTIAIPSGFVEDYIGNKNIAYTKTFTTVAAGQGKGQIVITTSTSWTVPFGANNISLVAVGGAPVADISGNPQLQSAGALAWINNIPISAGDKFVITVTSNGNTTVTKNNVVLIIAQGGTKSGIRALPLFDSSVISGKAPNIDYGGQAGGLSNTVISGFKEIDVYTGSAGGYTGYSSNSSLIQHGTDGGESGVSLLGTNGGGTLYGAATHSYNPGSNDSAYVYSTPGFGAVRIIWGTGRAYPATNVVDV